MNANTENTGITLFDTAGEYPTYAEYTSETTHLVPILALDEKKIIADLTQEMTNGIQRVVVTIPREGREIFASGVIFHLQNETKTSSAIREALMRQQLEGNDQQAPSKPETENKSVEKRHAFA